MATNWPCGCDRNLVCKPQEPADADCSHVRMRVTFVYEVHVIHVYQFKASGELHDHVPCWLTVQVPSHTHRDRSSLIATSKGGKSAKLQLELSLAFHLPLPTRDPLCSCHGTHERFRTLSRRWHMRPQSLVEREAGNGAGPPAPPPAQPPEPSRRTRRTRQNRRGTSLLRATSVVSAGVRSGGHRARRMRVLRGQDIGKRAGFA